jgi:uncharacterized membrane protein
MDLSDVVFEAVVAPHRSLSALGLRRVLAGLCAVCAINLALFAALQAWPVCGFTCAELLLAWLLIRLHVRAARATELLTLTRGELRIQRTDPNGRRAHLGLSPAWLQVQLEERAGRVPALWLSSGGRREEVGRMLGEDEKRDLARSLRDALHQLRHPKFDNPQLAD